MEPPKVENILRDDAKDITYVVMAYRQLTRDELIRAVGQYLSGRKKPKRGSKITILCAFS